MLHRPGDLGLPPYRYRSSYLALLLGALLAGYIAFGLLFILVGEVWRLVA